MAGGELKFVFDGKRLSAKEGDTIASALWRNGIKVITRSIKFHRPRGLHCGTGECPNCLANVNGIPNVRTCTTLVKDGMVVMPQNKFLSRNFDPFGMMDFLYKNGFDYHHRFMRPRFATGIYQRAIRRMTGIGRLPSGALEAKPSLRLNIDLAVIGYGPHAARIADICSREGVRTLVTTDKSGSGVPRQDVERRENVFFVDEPSIIGAFDDGSISLLSRDRLIIFKSKSICLALKGKEAPLRFANWDLPGVIRSCVAERLLKSNIRLGDMVVLAGKCERAIALAEMTRGSGCTIRAVLCDDGGSMNNHGDLPIKRGWHVEKALGRKELSRVIISDGERRDSIACDCLITCGPILPDIELARQLGCELKMDRMSVPRIAVNEEFETSVKGVFAIDSSAEGTSPDKTSENASIAAKAIIKRVREMRA